MVILKICIITIAATTTVQSPQATAVSFGRTGGGGGGRSGGGGYSFGSSGCGGGGRGYRQTYTGEGLAQPFTQYGNYPPTDWMPAIYGGNTGPRVTTTLPPPFAMHDPLADYYRQQEFESQMAQTNTTQLGAMPMPVQKLLPTDFGGVQGSSVSRDSVVTVEEGNLVRENFHGSGLFTKPWWKNYKGTWFSPTWPDDWVWDSVDWDTLVAFWRGTAPKSPADYEFGSNIVSREGKVFYGGQPLMTTAEYYHQGQLLAAKGEHLVTGKKAGAPHKMPQVKDWAQFGVFSLVSAGEKFSTKIIQLAVNRDGKLRGNCYDVMNDQVDRIEGEIDKSNSRVCFTVGKNRSVIYDTGLENILSSQSPILIHLDQDRAQQRALVRLVQSKL